MSQSASSPDKVLVLDGDMVSALAVTRSLGRMGLEVVVGSHAHKPISARSRYACQSLIYPDPMHEEAGFIAWLQQTTGQCQFALIVPITERTVVPIFSNRDALKHMPIALPGNDSLGVALNKSQTIILANQLGIPVPFSMTVSTTAQANEAMEKMAFPIVVKPARSMGNSNQGIVQLSVDYAFDESELNAKVTHALRFGDVILQEYFTGQGTGIELIADHGKIVFAFQHLRLHEFPLTGGGSSFRKSVPIEPELLEASQQLMAALRWHGVAMVEFKWNPADRSFRLMEINGRFWGSLPLAIAAGADFPAMLYQLTTQGHISPRPLAKQGIYGRKLSSDIYWYEQVLRHNAPRKLVTLPKRSRLVQDALMAFSPRHNFDVQKISDPIPGLIDIKEIVDEYSTRLVQVTSNHYFAWRQKRAWQNGEITRRLHSAHRLLFICYGNINRSALADCYFRREMSGMPIASFSAGFHKESGRPADPMMVKLAKQHGVDLSGWASHTMDSKVIRASDLIFVMEKNHFDRIKTQYPDVSDRVFLLSKCGEIDDPYGKSADSYSSCMMRIFDSVNNIINIIRQRT